MSIHFNAQTPGMDNRGTNLVTRAAELARSGATQDTAVEQLSTLAASDGQNTVEEREFLGALRNNWQGFTNQTAAMEPNAVSFDVNNRSMVKDRNGNKIVLMFSDNPSPAKQVSGDVSTSNQTLESLIPADRREAWQGVNKHNIQEVRSFVNSLHLNPNQRDQFIQNYLTANFNHPGQDIQWNGAGLQDGIDAVPTDAQGRKYLDCEAYLSVVNELGGGARAYALDADHSGSRNHQVGVSRQGDSAVVWSNNERRVINHAGTHSDEQLIQQAYPEFSNIVPDRNGTMRIGTEVLTEGENVPGSSNTTVDEIIDGTTARGTQMKNGGIYNVRINVNEQTGEITSRPDFRAHDSLQDSSGNTIVLDSPNHGILTSADGRRTGPVNVTVNTQADGSWNWNWTPAAR